jgi:hypothetical protein
MDNTIENYRGDLNLDSTTSIVERSVHVNSSFVQRSSAIHIDTSREKTNTSID